jgi:pyruvate dehydrogenase E1 component alpha subunit
MDVCAVQTATHQAIGSVRRGDGPYLLEYRTYRFRAHSMYDAELYRAKEEVTEWKRRDPISTFAQALRTAGMLADSDLQRIEAEIATEIEEAVTFAETSPWEPVEDLTKDVYTGKA